VVDVGVLADLAESLPDLVETSAMVRGRG